MAEQGDFGGPSFGGDQGGQSSAGGNTSGGVDPSASFDSPNAPQADFDAANAIEGMANALDNAANAIQGSGFDPSVAPAGVGTEAQPGPSVGSSLGSKAREQMDYGTVAMQDYGPSTYDYDFGPNVNVVSPLDQKEAFMEANPSVSLDSLGPNPSIGELSAAIGIDPATLGSNQGFDPSAPPSGAGYGFDSATVEKESPGTEAAAFLDDFNQATQQSPLDQKEAYMEANPLGANKAGAWDNPNTAYSPLESPNYPAWENPNTAYSPLENPNYSAWENPNTNLNWTDGIVAPTDYGSMATEEFDYDTTYSPLESPVESIHEPPTTDPTKTLAPKYGPKKGFVDHEKMYPGHSKKAAMAGVASVKSMFDGTHQGWIDAINKNMVKHGIELSHTLDGKAPNGIPFGQEGTNLSGKHSAANWGEYDAMFSPDENGVPVDKDGVAMPGTDKQAQKGISGLLQGIAYGMFSGLATPSTSSGVLNQAANTSSPEHSSVLGGPGSATSTSPLAGPGGAEGGEHPIDVMRSIYPWAASLPDSVLFNAVRYPDYLRLLIEADASGTELPLVVPKWILDGESAPVTSTNTSTSTGTNGDWSSTIKNHPAMQIQKPPPGWGVPNW